MTETRYKTTLAKSGNEVYRLLNDVKGMGQKQELVIEPVGFWNKLFRQYKGYVLSFDEKKEYFFSDYKEAQGKINKLLTLQNEDSVSRVTGLKKSQARTAKFYGILEIKIADKI